MNRHVSGRAGDVHNRQLERRGGKTYVGIVGEAETFLGNAYDVAVKLGVAVFVVDGGHAVVSRRHMFPYHRRLALAGRDWSRPVAKCLFCIFRPSIRRREKYGSYDSIRIAKPIYIKA